MAVRRPSWLRSCMCVVGTGAAVNVLLVLFVRNYGHQTNLRHQVEHAIQGAHHVATEKEHKKEAIKDEVDIPPHEVIQQNKAVNQTMRTISLKLDEATSKIRSRYSVRKFDWKSPGNMTRHRLFASHWLHFPHLENFPQVEVKAVTSQYKDLDKTLPIMNFYNYSSNDCHTLESAYEKNELPLLKQQHNAICVDNFQMTLRPVNWGQRMLASLQHGVPVQTAQFPEATLTFFTVVSHGAIDDTGRVVSGNLTLIHPGCKQTAEGLDIEDTSQYESYPLYDKVFIISQKWGVLFFHSTVENLPRLAPALQYLRDHPDIRIHVQSYTNILKEVLGIPFNRVVFGKVRANIVYIPAGVECGRPSLFQTQLLWWNVHQRLHLSPTTKRDTVVLIQRSRRDRYFKYHNFLLDMLHAETTSLGLQVEVFSDNPLPHINATARLFHRALMVIAPHGAGEANMIFSQPGTVLIEALCRPRPNMCYGAMAQVLGFRYHGIYFTTKGCVEVTAQDLLPAVRFYLQHRYMIQGST